MTLNIPKTVSHIAKHTKQPRGGYLPLALFSKTELNDGHTLFEQENLSGGTIGSAVEYLARMLTDEDIYDVFKISLTGNWHWERHLIRYYEENIFDPFGPTTNEYIEQNNPIDAYKRLDCVKGTDDDSIRSVCHLAAYDVCARQSPQLYKPLPEADNDTVYNIRIMAERSAAFLQQYGPVTHQHYHFNEAAYTDKVGVGEPDFLTDDTLWDFKCVRSKPTAQHTLQLLLYYLMGKHSDPAVFDNIHNLGIYNPRHNTVYCLPVEKIRPELIDMVNRELLGY